jgi:Fe-S cluster assembly protein SufD
VSRGASLLERLAPDGGADARAATVRAWFDAHGLPSSREEAWRYTAIADIAAALDRADRAPSGEHGLTRAVVDELAGDHGGCRLVSVNGVLSSELSDVAHLPPGVQLGTAGPGSARSHDDPADGFAALNELAGAEGTSLLVDAGVEVDGPLHLVHLTAPGRAVVGVHPRTAVRIGAGSAVDILETYAGLGGTSVTNASTKIVAGDSSRVTYHRLQTEADDSVHVGATRVHQAAGSEVQATSVMTGSSIARCAIDAHLAGPGAQVDLRGLYLARRDQRHDNVITVDHAVPHCRSTQLFKGVMDDQGRGSFTGHVIVRHGAAGTDSSQTNRNLVLSPTAQADTRPWLEIFADDVRCAHGATVGRLDDDALFYLRSRGIPFAESRALLVSAFAGEVVDGITPASLRDRISTLVAETLR